MEYGPAVSIVKQGVAVEEPGWVLGQFRWRAGPAPVVVIAAAGLVESALVAVNAVPVATVNAELPVTVSGAVKVLAPPTL